MRGQGFPFDGGVAYSLAPQAGNDVVNTDVAGRATITFARAFPAGSLVSVVVTGGNGEKPWVVPNPTETGFTFQAEYPNGSVITGSVRIFWQAMVRTQ